MNPYEQKKRWKFLLIVGAFLIGCSSLLYTNYLVKKLAEEEKKRVEMWASATKLFSIVEDSETLNFLYQVTSSNVTIPLILADSEGVIIAHKNIDSVRATQPGYLQQQLAEMKEENEPIVISTPYFVQYVYYKNSILLTQLRYYPFIQLSIIAGFLIVSYLAFSASRRAEQNQVWVGMSKETAHQLGTPLSSLLAWMEHLKEKVGKAEQSLIEEMENDVKRLQTITERFSKVGSAPVLQPENVKQVIGNSVSYIQKRSSDKVQFEVAGSDTQAQLNIPLFDWVIENLCKNAVNAMNGAGKITINVIRNNKAVYVDVKDTGAGIPKSKFETVFQPGYTTRKRGWGLGLSLVKRIIENYHNGKIFVKHSEMGKGTTFRIVLKG